jgi:hypothetical protein
MIRPSNGLCSSFVHSLVLVHRRLIGSGFRQRAVLILGHFFESSVTPPASTMPGDVANASLRVTAHMLSYRIWKKLNRICSGSDLDY